MSAIRPPVSSPLIPAQAPQAPVRSARASFFQAALDGRTAAAATEAAALPGDEPPTPPATFAAASPDRPSRPGALLDIRV